MREGLDQFDAHVDILRLGEVTAVPDLLEQIDEIFFSSSATKSFASLKERSAFRERWLGRYLEHDPHWFYVGLKERRVVGYLAGAAEDPAISQRFSDIGYFPMLRDETARFPAHLHVNVREGSRDAGIGSRLISRFVSDLEQIGLPGVHLVTGRHSRNIPFYERNGFAAVRTLKCGDCEVVMMGRKLRGD
jgi:GNAT superfamily N-acetyltransferase